MSLLQKGRFTAETQRTQRRNYLPWFCLAGQAVHECFTNARIAPSFVYSWPIRGWPSRLTINATGGGRWLRRDYKKLCALGVSAVSFAAKPG